MTEMACLKTYAGQDMEIEILDSLRAKKRTVISSGSTTVTIGIGLKVAINELPRATKLVKQSRKTSILYLAMKMHFAKLLRSASQKSVFKA